MTTAEKNSKLQIKKVKDLKIGSPSAWYTINGHVLFIEGLGYVAFKDSYSELTGTCMPYQPIGRRNALKSIIETGGFLSYDEITFVKA